MSTLKKKKAKAWVLHVSQSRDSRVSNRDPKIRKILGDIEKGRKFKKP